MADGNSIYEGESTWNKVIGTISGLDKHGALAAVAALHVIENKFA